jgi:hypothetical protein
LETKAQESEGSCEKKDNSNNNDCSDESEIIALKKETFHTTAEGLKRS